MIPGSLIPLTHAVLYPGVTNDVGALAYRKTQVPAQLCTLTSFTHRTDAVWATPSLSKGGERMLHLDEAQGTPSQ